MGLAPDTESVDFRERCECKGKEWPPGVSNGLVLPCALCGLRPKFDFTVTDECWQAVLGNAEYGRGVVCLPCFDRLATERGIDVSRALIKVQFTGIGKTIILKPQSTHRYKPKKAKP